MPKRTLTLTAPAEEILFYLSLTGDDVRAINEHRALQRKNRAKGKKAIRDGLFKQTVANNYNITTGSAYGLDYVTAQRQFGQNGTAGRAATP